MGRYDEALAEGAKLTDVVARAGLPTTGVHFGAAFVLSRIGRDQEADDHLRQGIELADATDQPNQRNNLLLLAAQRAIEHENYPLALERVAEAEKILPESNMKERRALLSHLLAGVAEARLGNLDAARAHLESQKEIYQPSDPFAGWWHHALEGEIALAAGDLEAAETAFTAGEPEWKMWFSNAAGAWSVFANNLPFRDGLARVRLAQGDIAGAIEIYRALLTTGAESKWTAALEPRYVLELARLLDASGDPVAAQKEYQRFLDLWKDADRDLPELKEARQHLSS
jgi:tetratricopeptide (TPR) repeat protein